jgi:tRNA/rRNA methyltransferase
MTDHMPNHTPDAAQEIDQPDFDLNGATPSFILVRPQMGENIGGAARAMWNFGLDRMRVVSPRDGWPSQKAIAMASGAGRLLDEAGLFNSVPDAVADCDFVFATTARMRDITKPVMSPERAMEHARAIMANGGKVGVMFGPERAGLENEDVIHANALITVPINPEFPSLNLAQCVLLTAYEWRRQTSEIVPEVVEMAGTDWASHIEVEKMGDHYEDALDTAGFFFPEDKGASMKLNLRNLWSRMPLTKMDVQMMHGIMRQMKRWKERS